MYAHIPSQTQGSCEQPSPWFVRQRKEDGVSIAEKLRSVSHLAQHTLQNSASSKVGSSDLGPPPVKFGISSRLELSQPFWTTCFSDWSGMLWTILSHFLCCKLCLLLLILSLYLSKKIWFYVVKIYPLGKDSSWIFHLSFSLLHRIWFLPSVQ